MESCNVAAVLGTSYPALMSKMAYLSTQFSSKRGRVVVPAGSGIHAVPLKSAEWAGNELVKRTPPEAVKPDRTSRKVTLSDPLSLGALSATGDWPAIWM